MTLHDSIVTEAPLGFSIRECPGAFDAYVARHEDGDVAVRYIGKNDAPAYKASAEAQLNRYLGAPALIKN